VRREYFEHVIAAAANIVEEHEFVAIGSQAIHGTVDEARTPHSQSTYTAASGLT
jgi:hypothetical protein